MNIDEFKLSQEMLRKIRNTPFQDLSDWQKVVYLTNPNDNGIGDIINIEDLKSHDLGFGNGGNWCRSSSNIHRYFKLNIYRGKHHRIIAIKLDGFNSISESITNEISTHIRRYYKNAKCADHDVLHEQMEIDHKIGAKLYQDPNDPRLKDKDYYQPVCKSFNDAKRTHCKRCQETKIRYDARRLGYLISFIAGNEALGVEDGKKFIFPHNPCYGCYWYSPAEFRKKSHPQKEINETEMQNKLHRF